MDESKSDTDTDMITNQVMRIILNSVNIRIVCSIGRGSNTVLLSHSILHETLSSLVAIINLVMNDEPTRVYLFLKHQMKHCRIPRESLCGSFPINCDGLLIYKTQHPFTWYTVIRI